MKRPHASNDVRERALAAVDAGHPVADVAAMYQTDPSTIYRWIRQWEHTGSAHARPRSGRPSGLATEQIAVLAAQVSALPDATLAVHCVVWEAAFGRRVSLSTMGRWLRGQGFTLKKRR